MTGPSPQDSLPDVPWGKVAGVAGAVAVAWLTVRGAAAVVRLASREVHDRVLHGGHSRRG